MPAGKLFVTVMNAVGLHDSQTFGKQDPYVVVQLGRTNFRGKTASDGGVNPTFNQKYDFQVDNEMELTIEVWNSNTLTSDSELGKVAIPLNTVFQKGSQEVKATVNRKGKNAGTLNCWLQFESATGSSGKKEIEAAFKKYDTQGHGGIDKNAFHKLLSDLGFFSGLPMEKQVMLCHAQFDAADTSKDGWIDFSEFAAMYNRLLDSMRQHPKAQSYVPQKAQFIAPMTPVPMNPAPAPMKPAPMTPVPVPMTPAPAAYPPAASAYPAGPSAYPQAPSAYPGGGAVSGYPAAAPPAYPGGYPVAAPPAYPGAAPPAYPGGYGAPPAMPKPYGAPQAAPQPYAMTQPPGAHGAIPCVIMTQPYGMPQPHGARPQPMYYGAPQYGGGVQFGGKKHKNKYKGKKRKGSKGFGMGAMGAALGGGLIAGLVLDNIFD